ncbi:MAG: nucleotide-binding protein [Acidobacteriaceae bacterium]|nr:nucleotide-binding protein [Acidobacteriaceae bacterium]
MLALDANILIRAVLGKRAREILTAYAGLVPFFVTNTVAQEAWLRLPEILANRQKDPQLAIEVLEQVLEQIDIVEPAFYKGSEDDAKRRLMKRDVKDWPTAALALTLGCPIWTEDADFFGTGIATWTTDRVEIYLRSLVRPS